jgi:hypothetical protein
MVLNFEANTWYTPDTLLRLTSFKILEKTDSYYLLPFFTCLTPHNFTCQWGSSAA